MYANIKRNAKIIDIKQTDEVMSAYHAWLKTANATCGWLRNSLIEGTLLDIKQHRQGFKFVLSNGDELTSAKLRDHLSSIFIDSAPKTKSVGRDIINYVAERFKAYGVRNKKRKIPNITIKEYKSWYYKEAFVKIEADDKNLTIKTLNGNIVTPYKHALKEDKIDSDWKGGNFKFRHKGDHSILEFVACVNYSREAAYEPIKFEGFDLNASEDQWMKFSDGSVFVMPMDISRDIQHVQELQALLREKELPVKERTLRSKQRKKIRIEWKEAHKKLLKNIRQVMDEVVISRVISNRSLLAIDGLNPGAISGTFGQDHIIKYLTTQCQNKGIPFYVVNPAYTSQRCPNCSYTVEENRTATDDFKCTKCGLELNSHEVGAINTVCKAEYLYTNKIPYNDYKDWRSEAKICKEYGISLPHDAISSNIIEKKGKNSTQQS